jgi:hypothetical protein
MGEIKQPLRGLIPLIFVIIGSLAFIFVGEKVFDIDPGMLSVYALFFVWMAFVLSLGGRWPAHKLKQPAVGIILITLALVIGVLHPFVMEWLGYGPEWHWPIVSNLFLAVAIVIAFDNKFVEGMGQPKALFVNTLFMYVFALLLLLAFGMVPAIWFAFFVFVVFWMDRWPFSEAKQPVKGIMLFAMMGLFALILEYVFNKLDTSFFAPEGGLWFVLFVFFLVLTSWLLETWPVKNVKQPVKAIFGLIVTIVLALAAYYVLVELVKMDAGTAGAYAWVFVSLLYIWDIVFGKWPAERGGA